GRALAAEAGEAVLHVDRVVGPALLAVVDDRQSGLRLLPHDVEYGGARPIAQGGPAMQPAFFSFLQKGEQVPRPGKAPGVRRGNPVGAALHDPGALWSRPSFMIIRSASRSCKRLMSASGSPSTSRRSAR